MKLIHSVFQIVFLQVFVNRHVDLAIICLEVVICARFYILTVFSVSDIYDTVWLTVNLFVVSNISGQFEV